LLEYTVKAKAAECWTSGLSVLIVLSDLWTAEAIAMLLRRLGHRVQIAVDGPSARRAGRLWPPDVVLFELAPPGADGWELAQQWQEPGCDKKPLLIALADLESDRDRARCLEVGIDLYLVKPADNEFLVRVLERFRQVIMPPDVYVTEGSGRDLPWPPSGFQVFSQIKTNGKGGRS
jgi:DNA-binding response OmpR family regulator